MIVLGLTLYVFELGRICSKFPDSVGAAAVSNIARIFNVSVLVKSVRSTLMVWVSVKFDQCKIKY